MPTISELPSRSKTRDYSLTGRDTARAIESGLAAAEWYHTDVPRKQMKELMQRSDGPAMRDTIIWFAALILSAAGAIYFWGSWWCVPFFFVYGTLYGSSSDARWHEHGHGTAFQTQWLNQVVYQIACFMVMRNPVTWRWSHARHHTDTIIVGRDPEIAVMRPPDLLRVIIAPIGILDAWNAMSDMVRIHLRQADRCREDLHPRVRAAQGDLHRAGLVGDLCRDHRRFAIAMWSILPLMLIGLPRVYGPWHMVMVGLLQHGGLADNVIDHRLNSRTVYMNPISRFLYLNMNYHVEHHMFPMVPYYNSPEAPRGDQARPADADALDPRRLPRDDPGLAAPAQVRGLLHQARAAADGKALSRRAARRAGARPRRHHPCRKWT